jgi:two-component system phosphate regulon response regulator PhoB
MDANMSVQKILLATQDTQAEKEISESFTDTNFSVLSIRDIQEAMNLLKKENPRAFLVDWEIAQDYISEINRIVQESSRKTALIVLSKHRKSVERIQVLNAGADECLDQTEEYGELVAKVKALIRRIDMVDNAPNRITIKDIEINLNTHVVHKAGKPIDLTYTQFKLLYLLVTHHDTIFSRDEILEKVWGENVYVTDRTVDVHVKRLREKLGEKKHPSRYIQTIHGLGYRFA